MKPSTVCLIRVIAPESFRAVVVDLESFTVGRLPENAVHLNSLDISREHLAVHVQNGEIFIEDLGSANGTWLAGQRLMPKEKVLCTKIDHVFLGKLQDYLTFEVLSAESAGLEQIEREVVEIRRQTAAENQRRLSEARREASELKTDLEAQGQRFLEDAQARAKKMLERAENDAEIRQTERESELNEITRIAQEEAEKLVADAREQALKIALAAQEQAELMSQKAQTESERMVSEARHSVVHVKIDAQAEAETILNQAHQQALGIQAQAEKKSAQLLSDAAKRASQTIKDNELAIDETMTAARQSALSIRSQAQSDATHIRERASQKGKELIDEGKASAQKALDEALAHAKREIETKISRATSEIEQLRRTAEAEMAHQRQAAEKELEQLRSQIAQTNDEYKASQTQQSTLEQRRLSTHGELEKLRAEIDQAQVRLTETKQAVGELNNQRLEIQALLEMTAKREKASLHEQDEVHKLRAHAEQDLARLRKQTEDELAQMKLEEAKQVKLRRAEEMQQLKNLNKHQAQEIGRHLQMAIIPKIRSASSTADEVLVKLSQEIEELVLKVMTDSAETQSDTIEQVIHFDNASEGKARRRHMRWIAFAGAALSLITLLITRESWQPAVERIMVSTSSDGFLQKQQDEWLQKSRYRPVQTDDFKSSYVDNVLFTRDYAAFKLESAHQDKWILQLNHFMLDELKLNDRAVVRYVGLEFSLVTQLTQKRDAINPEFEKEGIEKMRELESTTLTQMLEVVHGQPNLERIRQLERRDFEASHPPILGK